MKYVFCFGDLLNILILVLFCCFISKLSLVDICVFHIQCTLSNLEIEVETEELMKSKHSNTLTIHSQAALRDLAWVTPDELLTLPVFLTRGAPALWAAGALCKTISSTAECLASLNPPTKHRCPQSSKSTLPTPHTYPHTSKCPLGERGAPTLKRTTAWPCLNQ